MEEETELEEKISQSILYDLLIYAEWKQEPELPLIAYRSEGLSSYIKSALQYFRKQNFLEDNIGGILNWQHPWRLAVGDDGKVVAIIQDTCLEVRTSRDDYLSVVGKAALPKDPFPQWRRWDWSPDCSMLAIAFTNGTVSVYDLLGSNLFNIQPPSVQGKNPVPDKTKAFAACFFLQTRVKSHKWSSELVTVDLSGTLRSYLVSCTEGFQESHSFSLARHHPFGVTAVACHPDNRLLFVAGPTGAKINPNEQELGQMPGVSGWCVLNDYPFYREAHSDVKSVPFTEGLWSRLLSLTGGRLQSVIFRVKVSPSGRLMVALHSCGGVSIWHLPSLRLFRFWPLRDQPNFDASNPVLLTTQSKSKVVDTLLTDFFPVDVDWWSDQALVIARKSGAVTVCDAASLRNMLGDSPEFLAGVPQVQTVCLERGFMGLECETELAGKNGDEASDSQVSEEADDTSMEEEESSLASRIVGTMVYMITDMERFRPKRKRTRFFRRTYRLLALRSTTPEELYTRKLDNEEYTDALTLARQYGLDCDLVFQRQWRNSNVSIETIRDYLERVSKRSWILKECVERVPETLIAAKELLRFGLKVTEKNNINDGKITDVGSLNAEQLEVVRLRRVLLQYQDRLATYEKILGGGLKAEETFDHVFYDRLRKSSALAASVRFARDGCWKAVEIMLTYHGKDTLDHWLPILSNFPETLNSSEYKSLLPECASDGSLFPWPEYSIRESDWSEKQPFSDVDSHGAGDSDLTAGLYEREPSLSAYRMPVSKLTSEIVSHWYQERARTIERCSRMVDHALTFLQLGLERNIKDLKVVQHHLLTLSTLVYEVLLEDKSLAAVEKATPLECCNLLMSKTNESTFISDLRDILLPYLLRCEKHSEGQRQTLLESYVVGLSNTSLALPLKLFEAIRDQGLSWLNATSEEVVSMALKCLYAYPSCDQLDVAQNIIKSTSHLGYSIGSPTRSLRSQIEALHADLKACRILNENETPRSLSSIQALRNDPTGAVKLMSEMCRKVPERTSDKILKDLLLLQRIVFSSVPREKCFDVFANSLLTSYNVNCINRASAVLQCSPNRDDQETTGEKVAFERSRELILLAAREYVDSAPELVCRDMDFAKACLHLMPDDTEVQKELNFISSLESLHRFGLKLLPLHVRLHRDPLRLIVSSIEQKRGSHRCFDQIVNLAKSLNVCGGDERTRECQVLILIAEAAFKARDYKYCAEVCLKLARGEHASGWEIASILGRCNEFADIVIRIQLLSFALAHCPANMIQELLQVQKLLQGERLQHVISSLVKIANVESQTDSVSVSQDAEAEDDNQDSQSFLSQLGRIGEKTVSSTTNAVFQRVGDRQFWKNAFRIGWQGNKAGSKTTPFKKPLEWPSCHSFYHELMVRSEESVLSPKYNQLTSYSAPANLHMCLALLQITLVGTDHERDVVDVLARCAQEIMPEDNSLALAHLLQLSLATAEQTFSACPATNVSLSLAKYFAAIKLFDEAFRQDCLSSRDVFLYDPDELISGVLRMKNSSSSWHNLLLDSDSKLTDLNEGEELLRLGCGVDLERFTQDPDYRHDSILGLAMNEEEYYLQVALKLGNRHGVSYAELVSTYASALLLSDVSPTEVSTRLSRPNLKELFQQNAEFVSERLTDDVWPLLGGTQHQNLQTFFTLLNDLRPNDNFGLLKPKDHIRLLKKVRSVSKDIDYKVLAKGSVNIPKAVFPALSFETIGNITKLLKTLPEALECRLTPSELSRDCARKTIEGDKNLCLKTVSAVHSLLRRMTPDDILSLVSSLCYPAGNSDSWSIERNLQVVDICEEFCREAIEEDKDGNWKECFAILCRWRDHIRALKPLMLSKPREELYWHFYESQGDPLAFRLILRHAIYSEISFDVLSKLVSAISTQHHLTMSELLLEEIRQAKSDGNYESMASVLSRIEEADDAGIPVSESLQNILKELAASNDIDPDVRVRIIALIQNHTQIESEGGFDLLWHKTQAVIVSAWGRDTFNLASLRGNVEKQEKRMEVFQQLLQKSSTLGHCKALWTLLGTWPQIPLSESERNPRISLITLCLQSHNGQWSEEKADFLEQLFSLQDVETTLEEAVREQVQALRGGSVDVQLLIFLTLLCKQRTLHLIAVSLIQRELKETLHDRNVYLLLRKEMCCALLVNTPHYPHLVSALLYSPELSEGRDATISTLVNHLRARGCFAEAGSLLLARSPPVPRSLRTFSGAMAVISRTQSANSGRSTPSRSFRVLSSSRRSYDE